MEMSQLPVQHICSVLRAFGQVFRAFGQRGIFIVPHLLRHGASHGFSGLIWRTAPFSRLFRYTRGCWGPTVFYPGPSCPLSVASCNAQGDAEDLFYPGSSRVPNKSPFTTHKGMLRLRTLTGTVKGSRKLLIWTQTSSRIKSEKICCF
jgi:hypothetical protein